MNLQEQLIVRDFGRQFRSQVKKSLQHFQKVMDPLLSTLKDTITDLFKNFVPFEDKLQLQLVESCFHRYASRFEDQNYRFVLNTLDYLISGRQIPLEFKQDINYKYLTVIYLEQLRGYFKTNQCKSLSNLYQKLNDLKREKEIDEGQEGFRDAMFDDDETSALQQNSKALQTNQPQIDEGDNNQTISKKDIAEKDSLITTLNARLRFREQNLIDITAGYLKDIQLLREQLFRKEYNQVEESYNVSYININEIMDPKYRELMNVYLDGLKIQFEKKTQDLYSTIDRQKVAINNLKGQVTGLLKITKTMDTPYEMINKAIRIETDPYKIWKILQDIKGNFFFREVFENQRAIYGINYKEINQLMMTSKAYEREFLLYKQQVQDQQLVFVEQTNSELDDAIKNLKYKDDEISSLNDYHKHQIQLSYRKAMEDLEDQKSQVLELQKIQYNDVLNSLKDDIQQIENYQLKQVIHTWAMVNRMFKLKYQDTDASLFKVQVKQILIDGKIYTEVTKELQKQLKNQIQECSFFKDQNKELFLRISEFNRNKYLYDESFEEMQSYTKDAKQRLIVSEQLKRQADTKRLLIENSCSQIIRIVDPKMAHFRIEELKLNDKTSDLVQDFLKRLDNLDATSLRSVKEIYNQGEKNVAAFNYLVNKVISLNVQIQTDIQDMNIGETLNEYKQLSTVPTYDGEILQEQIFENAPFDHNGVSMQDWSSYINFTDPQIPILKLREKELTKTINEQMKINLSQKEEILKIHNKVISELKQTNLIQTQRLLNSRQKSENIKLDQQKSHLNQMQNSLDQSANSYQQPPQFTNDQIIQQVQIQPNLQIMKDNIPSINNTITITKQKQVYERLFNDHAQKAERIKELKLKLQLLERSHWEDVLNNFTKQKNKYIHEKKDEIKVLEPSIPQIKTTITRSTYSTQYNQKFYEKTKKLDLVPQEDPYANWFGKKHVQIEKMFNNFEQVRKNNRPKSPRDNAISPRNTHTARSNYSKMVTRQYQSESRQTNSRSQNYSSYEPSSSLLPPQIESLVQEQRTRKVLFKIR